MQEFFQYMMDLYSVALSGTWTWFATLSREEWLVVLACVSVAGFLCMRGFGSRKEY